MTEPQTAGQRLAEAAAAKRAEEAQGRAAKAAKTEKAAAAKRRYAVRVLLMTPCSTHGAEPGQPCQAEYAICESRAARAARQFKPRPNRKVKK